ncbi:Ig-like domain-containing protein [Flavobacterium sp. CS20]|uniref:Ig-like domain-containing protein n=1 Tax=Flavobacterium sp. CS20 TaxID=2775246 RepID=UPI001FFC880A|nr:Ig-like domain-containing protein [Flavobacterium sp. CS20]
MKTIKKYISLLLILLLATACDDGIDPISRVDPGPDAGAPLVTIERPINGFSIQVPEPVTSVNIKFRAEDDIELQSVSVKIDGAEIAFYDEFIDYRVFIEELVYDEVTTGSHVLEVSATDLSGNTTIATSNFSKEPPYTPLFPGETFYMDFDGSFTNLVTVTDATEVGNPGFAPEARVGTGAYAGAKQILI